MRGLQGDVMKTLQVLIRKSSTMSIIGIVSILCFGQSVTIKYFQKGHTFMAADAFHKTVEDEMRSMKYMYVFSDFEKAINAKGRALIMSYSDFKNYSKEFSKARDTIYPKLENVSVVRFKRGSS